jgi:hypothetical protein
MILRKERTKLETEREREREKERERRVASQFKAREGYPYLSARGVE